MRLVDAIAGALTALWANRLRTVLTVLGTVVGVLAVVAAVAVTRGLNEFVAKELLATGSLVFGIDKFGPILSHDDFVRGLKRRDIRLEDAEYLRQRMETAEAVVPLENVVSKIEWRGQVTEEDVSVLGAGWEYPRLGDFLEIARGHNFSEQDERSFAYVAILGADVVEGLFGDVDPVGTRIRLLGRSFEVIGTLKPRGSVFGQSRDNLVVIPITTLLQIVGKRRSIMIQIKARSPEVYEQCQEEATLLLKLRRGLKPWEEPDFGLQTSELYMATFKRTTAAFFAAMIGIVALGLLVGTIVMMNIMLVAVTERTHEIGIRKAVGARRRDIVLQFLVESAVLAGCGGLVGVAGASLVALLASRAVSFPVRVDPVVAVSGLGLAILTGLLAGIYPAYRAAGLDPLEALRREK